jgi:hypothetical protein
MYIFGHHGFSNKCSESTREMLWKALPESLEELWVTRAYDPRGMKNCPSPGFVPDCLLPALTLFIQNHRSYSSLARFRMDFESDDWDADWFDPLAMFCQSAVIHGIHCTVILTGLYGGYDGHGAPRIEEHERG